MRASLPSTTLPLLLAVILSLTPVLADSSGLVPELDRILARFSEAHATTETLRCRFEDRAHQLRDISDR